MAKAKEYLVVRGTSTRRSTDPDSPEFERWVDWEPGQTVRSWPAHTPVAEFLESGAWADPKAAKEAAE